MQKVTVLGFGSWATALAILLNKNGYDVTVWARSETKLQYVREHGRSDEYLTNIDIPPSIKLSSNIADAAGSDVIVFSVPSKATREVAVLVAPYIKKGQIVVSTAKGFEEGSTKRLSEVLAEELCGCIPVVFSGPAHAEEVALGLPSTCVAASEDELAAKHVQNMFMRDYFRIYTSQDVIGAELGGATKNVIALAAGIADGLGYGDNLKAAIITRGLAEISRLGIAMNAKAATFAGLTGIGDLIVTCSSMHSRNRRCGILLGQGKSLEEALKEVHTVVEGVVTAKSALALADKYGVELPIVSGVNDALFGGKPPRKVVTDLMTRDKTYE